MNKLFRQVKLIERKPQESGNYLTDKGYIDYDSTTGNFFDGEDGDAIEGIYNWFEPVEMPGNKDIDIESIKFAKRCDPNNETLEKQADLIFGYKEGFKAAINHLTGGK